ncbi:MAG: RNA 2',3'-cyclic phosphodiesterase [Chloroflexota bacterium]|nr:MAG: RNA 2',3'-cyclic phosphodiesterase [Chloroflexota bacterium]
MADDVIRTFIAVDLPPSVLDALGQISSQLQEKMPATPVRWVDFTKMHLTLKFLGDISAENIAMVEKILQSEASKRQVMEIGIGGIGAFPKERHPRVIWIGVEAPADLFDLRRGIEDGVARLGYNYDKYDFTPHLTLGRISRKASARDVRTVGNVLHDFQVGFIGVARIEAVHLYRSDLKPEGAEYTRLFSGKLTEQDGAGP